jgi:D-alanyl-lipoteichoic acid acyltransferase DltB (MBOAT superfamily)
LRDYLYRPLGGSRRARLQTYRNLAVTMLLGGQWHGAGWTFVVWGAIHGASLIAERDAGEVWRPLGLPHRLVTTMRWLLTFHVVSVRHEALCGRGWVSGPPCWSVAADR